MSNQQRCLISFHSLINIEIASIHRYVQFSEYLGFVRTMDEFRGMKLVRKDGEKNYAINIKVDFDTTKHLSDANIKRRKIIRDRLMAKENARLDEERKKQETLEAQKEKERFDYIFSVSPNMVEE